MSLARASASVRQRADLADGDIYVDYNESPVSGKSSSEFMAMLGNLVLLESLSTIGWHVFVLYKNGSLILANSASWRFFRREPVTRC